MAAGRFDGVDGSGEDPLLERGVADAEGGRGFAGLEENVCGGGHGSYASEVYARWRNGHAMDALVADAGVADPEVGNKGQDGGDGEDVVDPALALVVAHRVGFGVAGVIADAKLGTDL